jgi:hypothetical protein
LGGLWIASWPWRCRQTRHGRQAVWIGVVRHNGGGLAGFGPAAVCRMGAMAVISVGHDVGGSDASGLRNECC